MSDSLPKLMESLRPEGEGVRPAMPGRLSSQRRAIEPLLVLLFSLFWAFWGIGREPFVGTGHLRGLVAYEMYEGEHGLVPTVHGRVYLRKLPLQAWTAAAIGHLVARFDEQVARWPSAGLGALFILTIYAAARWWIDDRAGVAAVVLGAGNFEVLDYATRAELDIGVLAFTTAAVVLLGVAWRRRGGMRALALVGCYLAALAGSFWKAPHVLLTVFLSLGAMAWMDRRARRPGWWRFPLHPLQVTLAVLCVVALATWFVVLSEETSADRAGRFVLWEFLARVVPHSLRYLLELPLAIPQLFAVGLPASLLAMVWLSPSLRSRVKPETASAPSALAPLLAWFVPTFVFLMFVPSKAPRYWFLCLGAVTLLGVAGWRAYVFNLLSERIAKWIDIAAWYLAWMLTGVGIVASAGLLLALTGVLPLNTPLSGGAAAGGVIMAVAGLIATFARRGERYALRAALPLAVALLAIKPIHALAFTPIRADLSDVRAPARELDAVVPPGEEVFVLSDKPGSDRAGEASDIGYYSAHTICWPRDVHAALARAEGEYGYLLVRPAGRKRLTLSLGDAAEVLLEFEGDSRGLSLLRVAITPAQQRLDRMTGER